MKRRTFAAGLLGAVTLPFAVHAQRAGKPPVIGYIGANSEAIDRPRINAFMQRLSDLGWAEGRNIAVDARFTQGVVARAGEIAAEFVRRPVDLILTAGDAQVIAAKKATDAIPIVFAAVGDPVGNGLVASLPNPGGNATGLSLQLTDSVGKRVDLLRDLLPNLRHIGLIGNFINPTVAVEMRAAQSEARARYRDHSVGVFPDRGGRARNRKAERPRGSTLCLPGPADRQQHCRDQCIRDRRPAAGDVQRPRIGRAGWADLVRPGLGDNVPPRRRNGGQDPAWRKTRRHPGRAADAIQPCDQSQDRERTRPQGPRRPAPSRRSGDRMTAYRPNADVMENGPDVCFRGKATGLKPCRMSAK